jgi:hypothetical protein
MPYESGMVDDRTRLYLKAALNCRRDLLLCRFVIAREDVPVLVWYAYLSSPSCAYFLSASLMQ